MLLVKANFSLFSYSVFLVLEIKTLKLKLKAALCKFPNISREREIRELCGLDENWQLHHSLKIITGFWIRLCSGIEKKFQCVML